MIEWECLSLITGKEFELPWNLDMEIKLIAVLMNFVYNLIQLQRQSCRRNSFSTCLTDKWAD